MWPVSSPFFVGGGIELHWDCTSCINRRILLFFSFNTSLNLLYSSSSNYVNVKCLLIGLNMCHIPVLWCVSTAPAFPGQFSSHELASSSPSPAVWFCPSDSVKSLLHGPELTWARDWLAPVSVPRCPAGTMGAEAYYSTCGNLLKLTGLPPTFIFLWLNLGLLYTNWRKHAHSAVSPTCWIHCCLYDCLLIVNPHQNISYHL